MKKHLNPYGRRLVGKTKFFDDTDVGTIQFMGRNSSAGQLPTKSNEYKSLTRNSSTRNRLRRYHKKSLRQSIKNEINKYKFIWNTL